MNPSNPDAVVRTRLILEDLEAVRENLVELSDDIWSWIDHNDSAALDAGYQFKRAYNEKVAAVDNVAGELSLLIQQYAAVRLESLEQSATVGEVNDDRVIADLDREAPHSLE